MCSQCKTGPYLELRREPRVRCCIINACTGEDTRSGSLDANTSRQLCRSITTGVAFFRRSVCGVKSESVLALSRDADGCWRQGRHTKVALAYLQSATPRLKYTDDDLTPVIQKGYNPIVSRKLKVTSYTNRPPEPWVSTGLRSGSSKCRLSDVEGFRCNFAVTMSSPTTRPLQEDGNDTLARGESLKFHPRRQYGLTSISFDLVYLVYKSLSERTIGGVCM